MAKKAKRLSVHLTDKEQIWGLIYLLVSIFLLPLLLQKFNSLLPVPLEAAWYNFLYFVCNFLFIIWIFHGFFKRSLIYAGHNFWDFLLAVIAGAIAYWLLNLGLSWLLRLLLPSYTNLNDFQIITMGHSNFLIMFIGTVIFVPVAEETLHRGLVFGCLYHKNPATAFLLSAAVFSAVHVIGYIGSYTALHFIVAFLQYIPAGLVLAWAYRTSGSIFAPIVIHAVINAIGLLSSR